MFFHSNTKHFSEYEFTVEENKLLAIGYGWCLKYRVLMTISNMYIHASISRCWSYTCFFNATMQVPVARTSPLKEHEKNMCYLIRKVGPNYIHLSNDVTIHLAIQKNTGIARFGLNAFEFIKYLQFWALNVKRASQNLESYKSLLTVLHCKKAAMSQWYQ